MLLLDSAHPGDLDPALELGFVSGVTTNPKLLRLAGATDPMTHFRALAASCPGHFELYYQPTGILGDDLRECREMADSISQRLILKVPATLRSMPLARDLVAAGLPVSLTAAQSVGAYPAAHALGCVSVIPYYDRGLRDPGTRNDLIAAMLATGLDGPDIVAASVKSAEQVTTVLCAGAAGVTAPLSVLESLVDTEAARSAAEDFASCYAVAAVV